MSPIIKVVLSVFSQRNTRWKSAPFRDGQSLNPYPPRYKAAFASSCISVPHLHQCALRFHLPETNVRRGYGVSTPLTNVRFGTLSEGLHTNCTARSKHASCGTSGGTLGLGQGTVGPCQSANCATSCRTITYSSAAAVLRSAGRECYTPSI